MGLNETASTAIRTRKSMYGHEALPFISPPLLVKALVSAPPHPPTHPPTLPPSL